MIEWGCSRFDYSVRRRSVNKSFLSSSFVVLNFLDLLITEYYDKYLFIYLSSFLNTVKWFLNCILIVSNCYSFSDSGINYLKIDRRD